jgi:hypothetical protein
VWIAAHSPQAKGRVERSFGTARGRLVKGLRVAGARTLEEANRYLEEEFLRWWNQHLVRAPANPADAHRPLGRDQDLAATLNQVETRQVNNDYTIQLDGKFYQIERGSICTGLRGATVRIERRLDGSLAVRFRERYLVHQACAAPLKPVVVPKQSPGRILKTPKPSQAMRDSMKGLLQRPALPLWKSSKIDRTRTSDKLD